jgi:mannosyltransferase OCH1-like enzyme
MIPKIIHYCWFGSKPIPAEQQAYVDGWKVLMPDYELRRWSEQNSPMYLPYIQNALKNKKWANISNFVRLFAVYNDGGIYLDTDVEVLKSFDDLLPLKCFFGFETENPVLNFAPVINNATFGAAPEHPLIKEIMTQLLERFDGLEEAHLSSPNLTTEILRTVGFGEYGNKEFNGINVFPKEYFYPYYFNEDISQIEITNKTYSIHHWAKSWLVEKNSPKRNLLNSIWLKNLVKKTANHLLPKRTVTHFKNTLKPAQKVEQDILKSSQVLHGPFVGMRYPKGEKAFGSSFSPKIIGSYEECLHKTILNFIGNNYDEIYDIGCAEGYYVGGLSMLFPKAKITGYDISPTAIELANELIEENNFTSAKAVLKDVRQDFWRDFSGQNRTLIFCDVEGAEKDLFDEEAIKRLVRSDLIIELHDFLDASIKPKLTKLFETTHDIEIIKEGNKNMSRYTSLNSLSLATCNKLLDEGRPCEMEWLIAKAKISKTYK